MRLVTTILFLMVLTATCLPTQRLWAQESTQAKPFRTGSIDKHTKIFLVAGSSEVANFAQEIMDQKQFFLQRGFSEDEIACYYVPPYREHFEADAAQFQNLRSQLQQCFLADVNRLKADFKTAAKGKPNFIYLYFTTHGQQPFDQKLTKPGLDPKSRSRYERLANYPPLREHHLALDALPDGPANFWEILGAYRTGDGDDDYFLTASKLSAWLQKYFSKTPKFVVLQACYSGGFLENPEKPQVATLKDLKNITTMTAARQDRESFGCQSGVSRTVFGEAYLTSLPESPGGPLAWDWNQIYDRVQKKVKDMEAQDQAQPPSLPQFFSNQDPLQH